MFLGYVWRRETGAPSLTDGISRLGVAERVVRITIACGASLRPVACRRGACLLYPPSLFLLYDVNFRVLPASTVTLRI